MAGRGQGLRGQGLIAHIRENQPAEVYLVHGKEGWFTDRAIHLLKAAIFPGPGGPAAKSLNYDVLSGREVDASRLLTTCGTAPMFAQRRLVVIRDASRANDKAWKEFGAYFDDPCETTTLFVDWGGRKPDGRARWVKQAKKSGVMADCRPIYDNEVPDFIRHAADSRQRSLDHDAAAHLARVVGADLHSLEDAVERVTLYAPEGRISLGDVEECIADTRAHEIWDLTDAVSERRPEQALQVLTRVRSQGTVPEVLLGSLQRTIRQLWQAREVMAGGASRETLASALGLHPFVAGKVAERCRRFDDRTLARAMVAIAEAQVATRAGGGLGGSMREWVVLEGLVSALCEPNAT